MGKYTLKQFVKDCETFGWYESKVYPEWMENLDIEPNEENLQRVLSYKECEDEIPSVMDYREHEDGVSFRISYLSRGIGQGFINNKNDLFTYLRVAGLEKRIVPEGA